MKYFLFADNMKLYEVPRRYWNHLEVIENSTKRSDEQVNEAIEFLTAHCKVKLIVSAVSQYL